MGTWSKGPLSENTPAETDSVQTEMKIFEESAHKVTTHYNVLKKALTKDTLPLNLNASINQSIKHVPLKFNPHPSKKIPNKFKTNKSSPFWCNIPLGLNRQINQNNKTLKENCVDTSVVNRNALDLIEPRQFYKPEQLPATDLQNYLTKQLWNYLHSQHWHVYHSPPIKQLRFPQRDYPNSIGLKIPKIAKLSNINKPTPTKLPWRDIMYLPVKTLPTDLKNPTKYPQALTTTEDLPGNAKPYDVHHDKWMHIKQKYKTTVLPTIQLKAIYLPNTRHTRKPIFLPLPIKKPLERVDQSLKEEEINDQKKEKVIPIAHLENQLTNFDLADNDERADSQTEKPAKKRKKKKKKNPVSPSDMSIKHNFTAIDDTFFIDFEKSEYFRPSPLLHNIIKETVNEINLDKELIS